jgi:hypothetical protein
MKKILILGLLLLCPQLASAQTSRNPCYTTGALTTNGIANCIGVGNTTPLPSGQYTFDGANWNAGSGLLVGTAGAPATDVVTVQFPLASGAAGYPSASTPVTASSGNVAAAVATATLAAAVGKTTYICGFSITSSGSTAAVVVSPTVTNVITGTMTHTYASVAGATLANQALVIPFSPCIPASATNTTIPVSLPSLGAGNTNTTVNAWGYQQ